MKNITDMLNRLERDAEKYAQQFPSANERMKDILMQTYLSGELAIVLKLLNHFKKDE